MPANVSLTSVCKTFAPGARPVLDDIHLDVSPGETLTIIGPSGSGKSTLLNCIAGMEPYAGSIVIDGDPVRKPRRSVAMVFQAPHLLPWRTTLGNVQYGMQLQTGGAGKADKQAQRDRAESLLDLVGLRQARDRYPAQLSGGMQQRVNIARALAVQPSVLLMDEPFGALDAITKEHLQAELEEIVTGQRLTTIFITHDISEAIFLGDRVVVLSADPGRIAAELKVESPRPRPLEWKRSAIFQEYYSFLWQELLQA
jgi:NitT/TauT family transport system ATP-binding protein